MFKKDLCQFCGLSKGKKLAVGLVLAVAFFFGLFFASFYGKMSLNKVKLPVSPQVSPQAPKRASFTLVPQSGRVNLAETLVVGINFDSGDYRVEAADCALQYDPKILSVSKVSPGLFFAEYPKKEAKEGTVFLTGTIGVEGQQKGGVKGQGPFGSIEFKAIVTGNTTLSFVKGETIIASQGENVLGEVEDGTYIVK